MGNLSLVVGVSCSGEFRHKIAVRAVMAGRNHDEGMNLFSAQS